MEVAESTVLILFFLLPGFFFNLFLYQGTFERTELKKSALEQTSALLATTVLIHLYTYVTILLFFPEWKINYRSLVSLFKEASNKSLWSHEYLLDTSMYYLEVISQAVLGGFAFRLIILRFRLHRRIRFFRLANRWYYILTGEVAFFRENKSIYDIEVCDIVYVDILVKLVDKNIIYRGFVMDHLLREGTLDAISIQHVTRRDMTLENDNKDMAGDDTIFYSLPGTQLTVLAKDISNINITYLDLDNIEDIVAKAFPDDPPKSPTIPSHGIVYTTTSPTHS